MLLAQLDLVLPSSLQTQIMNHLKDAHLIGRNKEDELNRLSDTLGCSYSVADVLEDRFYRQN